MQLVVVGSSKLPSKTDNCSDGVKLFVNMDVSKCIFLWGREAKNFALAMLRSLHMILFTSRNRF